MNPEALGLVGLVIVYHSGPWWLIPPVRPFSCGFCLCFWAALAVAATDPHWGQAWFVGQVSLFAGLVAAFTPLFRGFEDDNPEAEAGFEVEIPAAADEDFHLIPEDEIVPFQGPSVASSDRLG